MNVIEILYKIDQRLYDLVDPETGEILDESAFASLQMDRAEKIENLVLWYKNTVAEYEDVKKEAEVHMSRCRTLSKNADRLKALIDYFLCGDAFKTSRCQVSYRSSESVEWEDTAGLISWAEENGYVECLSYKPPQVLKTAVKDLLKAGVPVPGAEIVKKRNVVVK